jgi:phosphate ABC transporter phosphate-binding protein
MRSLRIRRRVCPFRLSAIFRNCITLLLCILIFQAPSLLKPESLQGIKTIAIGPMGTGGAAGALRTRLIKRLTQKGRVKVTEDEATADAVLRGTSDIWATGSVMIDPHSSRSKQTNYQGYLSVELVNRGNELLWSYLVTPSRFHMGSVTDDLADRAASQLIEAIETGAAAAGSAAATGSHSNLALHAAGGTLPAPLYRKWFESAGFRVAYDAVGSEAGIEQLTEGKIDFAASDMPLTAENARSEHVLQVPTVMGGVVPIFNLPGLNRELYLTPDALAGIYAGKIRKWNDPAIRATNRGAQLPNAEIAVIHRSDGSGTTFVWTSYLSVVSPDWKSSVGSGTHVAWPAGTGAEGNGGVAELVKKTPNSIGYVELIYAIQHELSYAAVRNSSGHFVKADLAGITAAAASEAAGAQDQPIGGSILNGSNKDAYPISTFTWLLVPQNGLAPEKRRAIAGLLGWMLTSGQKQCSSLGYAPLPKDVASRALQAVNSLK